MSLVQSSNNVSDTTSANRVDKTLLNYLRDNNITNFLEWFNFLLTRYLAVNYKYGQIYCVSNVALKIDGDDVYQICFTENLNQDLKFFTELYIDPMEIVHVSEKMRHHELVFLAIIKQLSNYNLNNMRNFYKCDKEIIKSTIDSTIIEFGSTSIIDLIKKYNIVDDSINVIKNQLCNFIKAIGAKGLNKQCTECVNVNTNVNNIKNEDICSSRKMLIMSQCCNSYQIADY